jgi:hypothetical protein
MRASRVMHSHADGVTLDPLSWSQAALQAISEGPRAGAEALLQLALAQHSRDDVSVLLLQIKP